MNLRYLQLWHWPLTETEAGLLFGPNLCALEYSWMVDMSNPGFHRWHNATDRQLQQMSFWKLKKRSPHCRSIQISGFIASVSPRHYTRLTQSHSLQDSPKPPRCARCSINLVKEDDILAHHRIHADGIGYGIKLVHLHRLDQCI